MEQRLSLVTLGVADLARARAFYEGLGWATNTAPEMGVFVDPDGHPWEVAWNPHWTVRDEGSVSL